MAATPKRKPGRPRKDDAKQNRTLRLSPDVIEAIKCAGVARVEEILRAALL